MPKKLRAVEVIPDKFWITYDENGNKSGTLTHKPEDAWMAWTWIRTGARALVMEPENVEETFDFEDRRKHTEDDMDYQVLGYPVPAIETFKVQIKEDKLPCFTKKPSSKIYHAAGYYAIEYPNNGWTDSFCPKVSTLRKYTWVGPFKTEQDMLIAIQRKNREIDGKG